MAIERGGPETSRWLLAIDSSTEQAGVALFDGRHGAELTWVAGREQTVTLLGEIDHLLGLHGLAVGQVAAVAVATGPGMFNGLRVGVSVAKGLVIGLGIPLLGVSTLDAAALPYAAASRPTVAAIAAGRGRLAWATYGTADGTWRQLSAPRNGRVEELVADLAGLDASAILAGELTPEQEAVLAAAGAAMPPLALRARRPGALAQLAWTRFLAGEADDPVTLEPVYLHGTSREPSTIGD